MLAITCSRCGKAGNLSAALAVEFWEWEPVEIRWGEKLPVQGQISAERNWVCPDCFTDDERKAIDEGISLDIACFDG